MNSENPIAERRRFKNGVIAALEICAERRAGESGFQPGAHDGYGKRYIVDRAAAIVEDAAGKIGAGDLTALEALCASHVLALDVIFNQFARESAQRKTLSGGTMGLALRAQSQCRATLKTLLSLTARKNRDLSSGLSTVARRAKAETLAKEKFSTNKLLKTEISPHDQVLGMA